ncbi:dihydropteroate synthase [Flavobacterium stagni]|uniref:Dihydropteroate synthase n=1 Tax=Flavobacterium stagni TaxID=2506421 RepID=A0A4V1N2T6_9FLAO|nr:dihydropteroate synthase [Flavobacterium stagni]RXR23354.1 dihydropteroate synthase [Flavobacterium stagni]
MTLNCRGTLIDLTIPKIMGIVNLTPDSFYDGGKLQDPTQVIAQVQQMLNEGAAFIDVGGYSSRPNAAPVSEEEERQRVVPIIELLVNHFPEILISIDTFRSSVAEAAVQAGACLINDISAGLLDKEMLPTVARLQVPYIMMHLRGTPQTMTTLTNYEDIVKEMQYYFSERIAAAHTLGINDVIIDPGFGFAKTLEQNYEVLQKMELFAFQKVPVLVGVSRKSMIYKVLETTPQEALNGTTVLHTLALQKGASILRVHDVKAAHECVQILQQVSHA